MNEIKIAITKTYVKAKLPSLLIVIGVTRRVNILNFLAFFFCVFSMINGLQVLKRISYLKGTKHV